MTESINPDPSATPLPSRARRITLAGLAASLSLGVLIGASAMTFDHAEGTSYLSNDPAACINCHIMREQYDGWQKSAHHAVAVCNDCHTPVDFFGKYFTKMDHGWRHSKGFTLNDFHEPIQMKQSSRDVVLANCIRCHEPLAGDIAHTGLAVDGAKDTSLDCIHCHTRVAHGPRR
jgi:cytochrome c nitrite reductase small subunit